MEIPRPTPPLVLGLFLALCSAPASPQLDELLGKLGLTKSQEIGPAETTAGLKEALHIGTENAVRLAGREDGYFKNEAIKILMPENLQRLERGLRLFGHGHLIDEFVLSMNRAAEKAAPFAKEIFWDAILHMSFDDARAILTGGETAATDYFRRATWDDLGDTFLPVVREATDAAGVTRRYKELVGRYEALPFAQSIAFDVDQYVVDRGLGGLFYVLAEEERKIRTEPAARVTELLQRVFAAH